MDISARGVLSRQENIEIVYVRGYARDPVGEAYDASIPLVGWEGGPVSHYPILNAFDCLSLFEHLVCSCRIFGVNKCP